MPRITKGEEEIISAIERNVTKLGFDVGIRLMYIAKKENFNGTITGNMQGCWKQYSAPHLNGFQTSDDLWFERIDLPWEDRSGKMAEHYSRQALDMYKRRSYFFPPYTHIHGHIKPLIMSSESLATIYHFRGLSWLRQLSCAFRQRKAKHRRIYRFKPCNHLKTTHHTCLVSKKIFVGGWYFFYSRSFDNDYRSHIPAVRFSSRRYFSYRAEFFAWPDNRQSLQ